jgi:predicted nuclease with TOPRIM domain
MSITIETDLKDILNRLEQRFDKIDQRFDQLDRKLEQKLDTIQKYVIDLKIGLTKLEGKIETLDERLTGEIKTLDAKVDGVSTRIGNQEFISRTVLGGLILLILGDAVKILSGFLPMK